MFQDRSKTGSLRERKRPSHQGTASVRGRFFFTADEGIGYARPQSEAKGLVAKTDKDVVMTTQLQQAMTAGVFVEFHDAQGHCVGQAIFTDWHARPLPAVGDTMQCGVNCPATGRRRKLTGRVVSRQFEVQHADQTPCVWVRLALEVAQPANRGGVHAGFSEN
jgi:hypothetical protein